VGLIVGGWHFGETQGAGPGDELATIAAIGRRLQAAMGLRVELQVVIGWRVEERREDHTLRIPTLREELFDWMFNDRTVTVHGFIPGHPYLWENLDAVMTAAGGSIDTAACVWQPNPAHARLRTRWDTLSPRDRFLLAMPSLLGARPFDRLLSQTAR
jgi:hypothetical protein